MNYFVCALFAVCLVAIVPQGEAQGAAGSCLLSCSLGTSGTQCSIAKSYLECLQTKCKDDSTASAAIAAAQSAYDQYKCSGSSVIASLLVTFFAALFSLTSKM